MSATIAIIISILLPAGIGFLLLSLMLLMLLWNERRAQERRLTEEYQHALDLPEGELVYEDMDGQGEALVSDQVPLLGKPTYVVKLADGRLAPIEVKNTAQNGLKPASQHVLQIAAYCLILEDYSELPPLYGIIRYSDREFTVDYTPALRKKVIRLLEEMSLCNKRQPPPLQKQKVTKCRACIFKPICPVGQGK
jgi:CRISPR-associated exonuclease Cas4